MKRRVKPAVREALSRAPAVALLGPRQCGKTTLARQFPCAYFDLEQEEECLRLDLEWQSLVARRRLIVLDEAQAWPAVFPRLRAAIDADRRRNGRFLLLGSVSPALMREVSESLAGRLALREMTPFLVSELPRRSQRNSWLMGGYPDGGILGGDVFPAWQRDYLTLLAERDLPNWGLAAQPRMTERLFKMLAIGHGATWNASNIGRSLGLSYHTVNSYVDYLQGAYLVRLLPPLHANLRKRLVKNPKLYWRDSGLLHSLLGVRSLEDLVVQPWVGLSFEGWVIEQVLSHLASRGIDHEASFFRTADGDEIDLVLDVARKRWAIEIKLTTSPKGGDLSRVEALGAQIGADVACLVSRTTRPIHAANRLSTHLAGLLTALDS